MANELTIDMTPADQPELSPEEQESLQIGEQLAEAQNQLLAGKYRDAQELEKAYLELQQTLGGKEETQQDASEEAQDESPSETTVFDTAASEWAEKGELSSDTMAKLKELPSEDLLNAYLESQKNLPQQTKDLSDSELNSVYNSVGGEQNYRTITSWAADNLGDSAVNGFNELVNSGSPEAIKLALAGIQAGYENANGYEGRMLSGKAPTNTGEVFRSQAEVVAAMSDPRYDKDPAYRNDVFEKLDRSNLEF